MCRDYIREQEKIPFSPTSQTKRKVADEYGGTHVDLLRFAFYRS